MECIHGARVSAREQISPVMVRLTLEFDEPGAWVSTGVGDEFVHVDFGATSMDADGHTERHYTVSGLVGGGIEMEIYIHGHGQGSTWGRTCQVGDTVHISDPWAYYKPPAEAGLRVLVGDLTALPGIARILKDASPHERFHVMVEVPDASEERELPSPAQVNVEWHIGGNGIGPSGVCESLRSMHKRGILEPDCYVWVACESKESRRARTLLRKEVGLPIPQQRLVGYWHANLEEVMEKWNALSDEVKDQYLAIWREDRSDEDNWTELEPFLQAHGA